METSKISSKLSASDPKLGAQNLVPSGVCAANTWQDLKDRYKDDKNLGILHRPVLAWDAAIDEILSSPFMAVQFTYQKGQDIRLVGAELDEELNLQSASAGFFYADVMSLAEGFLQLSNSDEIGIRLERVVSDKCKYLHVDLLSYRLITTYRGPTTEYLPNDFVIRSGLGQQDNAKVCKDFDRIESLPDNSVAIMKGEKFNTGKGLVHRSPAYDPQQPRLILRMDVLGG